MQIIDGKKISADILKNLEPQISKLPKDNLPSLAVILVGDDPASHLYVSIKEKRAEEIGINFQKYLFPADVNQAEIIALIDKLNNDPKIHAILVQLPLPKQLDTDKIISHINTAKDADGIHPDNLKLLQKTGAAPILPATTGAIDSILDSLNVNLKNKSVAIIGKSKIVGLPTYYYLKNKSKKINIYDKHTLFLSKKTKRADIIIVAIGKAKFITDKYIKTNAIVIDIGINKVNNETIGDVDFTKVQNIAQAITPVPGGVGPITVSILLKNTLHLFKNKTQIYIPK